MAKRQHKKAKNVRRALEERASRPANNTQADIDECKARVEEGAKCFCRDKCHCRTCWTRKRSQGEKPCSVSTLLSAGGCELGCNQCQKCQPCW